jgi:hypothetical protein
MAVCASTARINMTQDESQEPVAHWSDCAVHSEPAYPKGECDCGGYTHPPQRTEQEPVGEVGWLANVPNTIREVYWKKGSPPIGTKLFTRPPQRTEQNFCSRCGKRTKDLTHIYTCTPPQD